MQHVCVCGRREVRFCLSLNPHWVKSPLCAQRRSFTPAPERGEWKQKSCVHVLLSVFWSCWLLVLLTETFLRGNHFHLMLQQVLVWTRYLDSEGSDPVFVLRSSMLLCLSPDSLTVSQFCGLLSSRKLYKLCVTSSSVFSVSVWNSCVSLMFWWDQMFHQ